MVGTAVIAKDAVGGDKLGIPSISGPSICDDGEGGVRSRASRPSGSATEASRALSKEAMDERRDSGLSSIDDTQPTIF